LSWPLPLDALHPPRRRLKPAPPPPQADGDGAQGLAVRARESRCGWRRSPSSSSMARRASSTEGEFSGDVYAGSTMLTVDLKRTIDRISDPPDISTAAARGDPVRGRRALPGARPPARHRRKRGAPPDASSPRPSSMSRVRARGSRSPPEPQRRSAAENAMIELYRHSRRVPDPRAPGGAPAPTGSRSASSARPFRKGRPASTTRFCDLLGVKAAKGPARHRHADAEGSQDRRDVEEGSAREHKPGHEAPHLLRRRHDRRARRRPPRFKPGRRPRRDGVQHPELRRACRTDARDAARAPRRARRGETRAPQPVEDSPTEANSGTTAYRYFVEACSAEDRGDSSTAEHLFPPGARPRAGDGRRPHEPGQPGLPPGRAPRGTAPVTRRALELRSDAARGPLQPRQPPRGHSAIPTWRSPSFARCAPRRPSSPTPTTTSASCSPTSAAPPRRAPAPAALPRARQHARRLGLCHARAASSTRCPRSCPAGGRLSSFV